MADYGADPGGYKWRADQEVMQKRPDWNASGTLPNSEKARLQLEKEANLKKQIEQLTKKVEALERQAQGFDRYTVKVYHVHESTISVDARTLKEAEELALQKCREEFGLGGYKVTEATN